MTNSIENVHRVEDLSASHVILLEQRFETPMRPLCIFLLYGRTGCYQKKTAFALEVSSGLNKVILISLKNDPNLSEERNMRPGSRLAPGRIELQSSWGWASFSEKGAELHSSYIL
ncbi:hypothetical protein AVEN_265730-1 [Araneus ventricosus]|uniref:Uncharacterized protein n=1 Tax=Araneus ventricosus TaxID=182803 RepID=A0A4Y2TKM5_ARAVE|nr:hypothetical protein AVEN_265730-1 [Araneus ventricosus]